MGERFDKIKNAVIEWGQPEKLNKLLEGTGFTVSRDMEVVDSMGMARGALSLAYIDEDRVKINHICPYGTRDTLAIAIDAGRK